jgi:hypothetical protein
MTDDSNPKRLITLRPLTGSTKAPLRRTLARTAWQRSPFATINYDVGHDRVLIQLIDAPTVAEAILNEPDGAAPTGLSAAWDNGTQFVGFDGTDADAWPTTIAVLDLRRRRDTDSPCLWLLRELCGLQIWKAALMAAHEAHSGRLEVPLGPKAAQILIDRWHIMLTTPSVTDLSDATLRLVVAGWHYTMPASPAVAAPGRPRTLHGPAMGDDRGRPDESRS